MAYTVTIKSLEQRCARRLLGKYPAGEVRAMLRILFDEYTGVTAVQRLTDPDQEIMAEDAEKILEGADQLMLDVPVQYIVGKAWFYGMELFVNSDVLIPRPETEELVARIIDETQRHERLRILEIGTGSGCIAIALKKELPHAEIIATDISQEALKVAEVNAQKHGATIQFLENDIFSDDLNLQGGAFDLIVSNPPYVRFSEKKTMKNNVAGYEPQGALFVPDADPLVYYRRILETGNDLLGSSGTFYFEINRNMAGELDELLLQKGFGEFSFKNDFAGNVRMLQVRKRIP